MLSYVFAEKATGFADSPEFTEEFKRSAPDLFAGLGLGTALSPAALDEVMRQAKGAVFGYGVSSAALSRAIDNLAEIFKTLDVADREKIVERLITSGYDITLIRSAQEKVASKRPTVTVAWYARPTTWITSGAVLAAGILGIVIGRATKR